MSGSAPDDLYSLLGGAHSGIEAPIGDRRIPCVPPLPAQHTFPALTLKARGSDQTHTFPCGGRPWAWLLSPSPQETVRFSSFELLADASDIAAAAAAAAATAAGSA
jgi:hypothetical protein